MNRYRVSSGEQVDLRAHDPRDPSEFAAGKVAGKARLKELNTELEALQELLYAEGKHKIIVVLQGMDTSGKDGAIRHVFDGVNPQGVKVASFGVPTREELDHDYLWRIHKRTPGRGQITIFNRSHYEDVLVVKVRGLAPPERIEKRYAQIAEFERMLVEEGTTIRKFFLHISKDEQKQRLQDRLDQPEKNWKFNPGDLVERGFWDDYIAAYETALARTSTEGAPWYVVPSDRKWYRNLVIASVLSETLKGLDMQFPPPAEALDSVVIE
ncbi:MAG TPA: polyphosphate kinase 2 family protein [Anaerolineales bacterium]|nr:polyphosphate kinase 2 family protein [Anaerolineales bacterium]